VADLRLAISVDSSGAIQSVKTFNSEVDKMPAAAGKASSAVGGLQKVFNDFTSSFGTGLGLGAGFSLGEKAAEGLLASFGMLVNGAKALANEFAKGMGLLLDYSDRMVTLSQRTGLTTSALQVFAAMAKASGTDVDTLAKAAVKMEVAIGKGDESFRKLGLSLSQLKAMSPDAAFERVASAIGGIEDPMQRASAAVAIFGKSGAEMLPLFASNMAEARKQAEDFGLVLNDKTVTAAEALGDKVDMVGMSFEAFLMRIAGVIAQSPALAAVVDQLGIGFGSLSKAIDAATPTLTKWVDIGILAAVKGIELLISAFQTLTGMFARFGGIVGTSFGFAAELSGLNAMTQKMKEFAQETQKAVLERASLAAWAAKNQGALTGLPKPGAGGGSFDGSTQKPVEIKVNELKVPNLPGMWTDLFGGGSAGKFGTLQGGSKNFNIWGEKSKFLPPELAGNIQVTGANDSVVKSTMSVSQALQNLANVASVSGSKLGKSLSGILGGAGGIASGISGLKSMGGGLTGLLGKAGMWGGIAASALSIGSSIFGLFKKKPKEPPPEPPKKATAESWRNFVSDQQSKAAEGALAMTGIKVTTAQDMKEQASIALGSFWATWREKGPVAAAEAFKPARDAMLESFKATGASDTDIAAMLGPLSAQVDLGGNKAFAGAAGGLDGLAKQLAAMANQQLPLTIDMFRAFESQGVNAFEQMKAAALDQGFSMEDAIKNAAMASGQYLTTIKDAASKYGFDLGGSKALFDAASGAGVAFAGDSQERLIQSLDALTTTLGGAPPKFEQAFANAGTQAGNRLAQNANTGIRGDKYVEITEDGIGGSTAKALEPGFMALSDSFAESAAQIAEAIANMKLSLDTGALVGGIANAVRNGTNPELGTALGGR